MVATQLFQLSLSTHPKPLRFNGIVDPRYHFTFLRSKPRRPYRLRPISNSLSIPQIQQSSLKNKNDDTSHRDSPILLDVSGMMCGACVARVKSVITADERVDSVVVNMLTETAAIRLKPEVDEKSSVGDSVAKRVSECGFEAKVRVSGAKIEENVNKWREMGGLALGALLGPGRDLLFDGLKAFKNGSPNMNSLVGFGSTFAFIISAVSLLNPGLQWDASFFDEPFREPSLRAYLSAWLSDFFTMMVLVQCYSLVGDVPFYSNLVDMTLVLVGQVFNGKLFVVWFAVIGINEDGPLRIEASSTGANSMISKIVHMVEEAQGHEAPIQRLADSIAGPFVYIVMSLSAATFAFWYYIGTNIFPEVLLSDIAGADGDPLLLSLKLCVDVLVVSCPCALGLATPTAILVGTSLGARQGLLIRGGDVLERLASVDYVALDKTGTLTEGKPIVSAVASFAYEESEILRIAAAVEKTASHPIANAIIKKAELLNLTIPATRGQLTEPGSGTLAEVDGLLVAVGTIDWVRDRFQQKTPHMELLNLEHAVMNQSSNGISLKYSSKTVVYVGREGDGIVGAIAISDSLRPDAESTVHRLQQLGIKTVLLSGDREEAVAAVAKKVGVGKEFMNASLTPQQKSEVISTLQRAGHRVAMVGDGINDAPSLALANVGIALQTGAQENAASNAASVILLGNKLSQVIDALELAQATMGKVYQNLSWAVAYNMIAIPIAAGVLLPRYEFAMTPSLSGGLMALSSIFVVTNSLLLQFHASGKSIKR
ncbi:hypothetical protein ACFE04_018187 [Oxalis oulophora]